MKINYYIYVVEDNDGNKEAGVANDNNDIVHLSGLKDRDGEECVFEAEFYHIKAFCELRGLEFRIIAMDAHV